MTTPVRTLLCVLILMSSSGCGWVASKDAGEFSIAYSRADIPSNIPSTTGPAGTPLPNPTETTVTVVKSGNTTTTTTKTETLPATVAPPPAPAPAPPPQSNACSGPGQKVVYVAASSGTATISACAASLITSAVDYCVYQTGRSDFIFEGLTNLTAGGAAAGAIAAGIGAAAGLTGGALAGAAVGGVVLTNGFGGLQKIIPSTPPAVTMANLYTAAEAYLGVAAAMPDSLRLQNPKLFYAGLWNAVGSACPADRFKAYIDPASLPPPSTATPPPPA